MKEVLVVRTGTANLASVLAGLRRAGAEARVTHDPSEVEQADRLVLPGVGSYGAAMDSLQADGLVEALRKRIEAGRPTLAICLGLQVLCDGSDESPDAPGLGVAHGRATRFPADVRTPQIGWNRVEPSGGCALVAPGHAYFANSYRLVEPPEGWNAAFAEYGGRFVAAFGRGRVLACQFHPELSGKWGHALIERWLT